mmetsp:Transcript_52120/g.135166  ORF Transcript_52120/g.135166 Transcript_52120/m.135166 type:complete len:268 (-) Transcript_52120:876-1679(-)
MGHHSTTESVCQGAPMLRIHLSYGHICSRVSAGPMSAAGRCQVGAWLDAGWKGGVSHAGAIRSQHHGFVLALGTQGNACARCTCFRRPDSAAVALVVRHRKVCRATKLTLVWRRGRGWLLSKWRFCRVELGFLCERNGIVGPEGARDRGLGLARLRADRVGVAARLVVLVACRAIRQHFGAPIRLSRRLEVKESVDQRRQQVVGRRRVAEAGAAHIAPAAAVSPLGSNAVPRRIDQVVRVPVWDRSLDLIRQCLDVVVLIIAARELR